MKNRKNLILPALLLLLAVITTVCYGAAQAEKAEEPAAAAQSENVTVQNGGVTLSYNAQEKNFTVTDQDGFVWQSAVYDDQYDSELLNELWLKKVRSVLQISYADISKKNPTVATAVSADAEITVKEAENGLELVCRFKKPSITLTCQLSLENGELVIRIPADKIKEEKKNKLIAVEVLPYFGACADGEAGYLMYPDGSGAIKHHATVPPETMANTWYTWDIYGSDLKSLDTLLENQNEGLQSALLPVYGIKKGDHAFIAYSHVGEEEGSINMYPSGYGLALNRMSMSFRYRTTYDISMSNININGNNTAQNINGLMYNQEIIPDDHEVRLSFLPQAEANYSGMANRYRQILLDNGDLQKSDLVGKTSVAVNILMAASEQGFWSNSVAVTTTADQAADMMAYVKGLGFGDTGIYTLKGWGKGGYGVYPQTAKPDGKVGKLDRLTKLPNVLLQTELLLAGQENGGFDKASDACKQGNQNVITNEGENRFLFNPQNVQARMEDLLASTGKKGNLALSSLGKVLYRDENEKAVLHRSAVAGVVKAALAKATGTVSVDGANRYVLPYADMIFDLPTVSSEYFITDMDIPFCQMVLHGSVVYTAEQGNLSSDYNKQLLRWLEYGCLPSFELTACNSETLKNTNCSSLYSSQYQANRERLEKAYRLHEEALSKVADAYITEHTLLEGGLVQVRYSNGCRVIVNYTNQQKQLGNVSVAAGGYAVIGE